MWFNERCRLAKEKRDKMWRNLRRRRTNRTIEDYHRARNIYTQIRREEEANYEKDIVDKYNSDQSFSISTSAVRLRSKVQFKD